MLHEYIALLLPLHPVDRVARGRHEALCERAAAAGGDAAAGRGQLGGQAAGGGVGQADGGGRHEGLQASASARSQFCGSHNLCMAPSPAVKPVQILPNMYRVTILYREKPAVDLDWGSSMPSCFRFR